MEMSAGGKRFSEPRQTPFGADVRLPQETVCHQKWLTSERVAKGMHGDAYTFIALDWSVPRNWLAWLLGKRYRVSTEDLVSKIRWATAPGWFDVSTDGFRPHESPIDAGPYDRANHAQVAKLFSTHLDRIPESYGPARFVSVAKDAVSGNRDLDRAGTSHVERKNGTMLSGVSG